MKGKIYSQQNVDRESKTEGVVFSKSREVRSVQKKNCLVGVGGIIPLLFEWLRRRASPLNVKGMEVSGERGRRWTKRPDCKEKACTLDVMNRDEGEGAGANSGEGGAGERLG